MAHGAPLTINNGAPRSFPYVAQVSVVRNEVKKNVKIGIFLSVT
jgi:hypothetical protein